MIKVRLDSMVFNQFHTNIHNHSVKFILTNLNLFLYTMNAILTYILAFWQFRDCWNAIWLFQSDCSSWLSQPDGSDFKNPELHSFVCLFFNQSNKTRKQTKQSACPYKTTKLHFNKQNHRIEHSNFNTREITKSIHQLKIWVLRLAQRLTPQEECHGRLWSRRFHSWVGIVGCAVLFVLPFCSYQVTVHSCIYSYYVCFECTTVTPALVLPMVRALLDRVHVIVFVLCVVI